MKRLITTTIILSCLSLTACSDETSIGVIGGADGPTKIYVSENAGKVKGQFGEQLEKKAVRMFNLDGDLYYDSGLVSEMTPRCGTMDGNLKKTVKENEIPLKSGEANFEVKGYQHATSKTKEVNIDGDWVIFKKYDNYGKSLDGLKYGYYIKGHLNNAATDSEMIVLSSYADVTFNDIYDSLLSSQYPSETPKGAIHFNYINADKWGITLHADDVTPSGMTLKIEQFSGEFSGNYETGQWFKLEKNVNDEWRPVETNPLIDYVWEAVAYTIKNNDITEFKVEWKWLYGELSPGYYRLTKEIMFTEAGKFDKNLYSVDFVID